MKNFLFICVSVILIFGCTPKEESTQTTEDNTQQVTQQQTEPQPDTTGRIGSLLILNKADYHPDFIKELQDAPLEDIVLDGNKMIEGEQIALFPDYPAFEEQKKLSAKVGKTTVNIVINRINQTTIDYTIEFLEEGKKESVYQTKGEATISASSMYMGSESDENELTGNSYMAIEYIDSSTDEKNNECYTYIRIGKEEDNGQLLGRLIKNCNGQYDDIDLDYAMFTEVE
ncbi:MAG: hypothetical protein AB8G11_17225 [Saprospiraceae bacterium]